MKKVLLFLFFFLNINSTIAEIIVAKGTYKHLGDLSPKKACELAEKRAKENAIKEALGLKISLDEVQTCKEVDGKLDCEQNQTSILSLNGDITEVVVTNRNDGIDELSDPKIYFCEIEIKANVEAAFKEDPNFTFDVNINKKSFQDGDNLIIDLNFTESAYLTIYQFFPYEKSKQIMMLYPNKREKNNKFDAGGIILPKNNDTTYKVVFPNNLNNKTVDEHLIFVATKNQFKWLDNYSSLEDLNKRLIEIGKNNIVSKRQKTYTIYQK